MDKYFPGDDKRQFYLGHRMSLVPFPHLSPAKFPLWSLFAISFFSEMAE